MAAQPQPSPDDARKMQEALDSAMKDPQARPQAL